MPTDERIEPEEERQIVTTRVIEGPRELVFRAWTDPRHLNRWFGPHGFTTTTRVFDFRPGGVWDFDMNAPDGTVFPNHIEWRTIVPPERIEYVQGAHENDPEAFETTVTFAERAGGTEITLRVLLRTRARKEYLTEHFNAVEGARETLERLAAWVAELGEAGS